MNLKEIHALSEAKNRKQIKGKEEKKKTQINHPETY